MQMFLFCYRAPMNYSPGGSDVILQNGGGVEVGELTLLNPTSLVTSVEDHTQAIGGV